MELIGCLCLAIIMMAVGPLSMYLFVYVGAILISTIGIMLTFGSEGTFVNTLAVVIIIFLTAIGAIRLLSLK